MAGPFLQEDFERIIPPDKKLSKQWIDSLYARGNPLSATGEDLKFIGMPTASARARFIWEATAGSGFGTWKVQETGKNRDWLAVDRSGYHPLPLGPGLCAGGRLRRRKRVFTLDCKGFEDVVFTNRYPMARVTYADAACPLASNWKPTPPSSH